MFTPSLLLPSWLSSSSPWLRLLAVDFGVQLIGWVAAATFKTEKFYDVVGEYRNRNSSNNNGSNSSNMTATTAAALLFLIGSRKYNYNSLAEICKN